MEELIGKLWDRWVSNQAATEFPQATVLLEDLQPQLSLYFRALGGAPAKTLEPASARKLSVRRSRWQRVAGSHRQFHVAWQDDKSLCLPPALALFSEVRLNESLYFWLVAMAARMPVMDSWFVANQLAVVELCNRYPGLRKHYDELAAACLASRPAIHNLPEDCQARERAVLQALESPGSVTRLPYSPMDVYPVGVWLYAPVPSLHVVAGVADRAEGGTRKKPPQGPVKTLRQRKQAQRLDDTRETDGLLIFLPDTLMSWTEQVNLDRVQDDDDDGDVEEIARDLDIITLSRQRKASAARVKFNLDLPAEANDELSLGVGIRLPEWHYRQGRLLPDVCLLQPMLADHVTPAELPVTLLKTVREVKQLFASLGMQNSRLRAQAEGDEVDLDAWLDHLSRPLKESGKQNFFMAQRRNRRDFSCLILADLSLSTEGYIDDEQRVIDVIRDSLLVFGEAMHQLRDDMAIYGFSSVRNNPVRYHVLKHFGEPWTPVIRGRITRIKPGFYTRMGAAIRQSTRILQARPAAHRILLILSDGKPNDLDQYEGRYGIEDTRQAILEARQLGLTPFCVTVDAEGHEYLPYLFGREGFAVVTDPARLPRILPAIYLQLSAH